MLSPEYLDLIEFNDVVELYNRLNIEITADIIDRVSQMQDITETSKSQLKILKETNGLEIFNKALEETSMLTAETKRQLKELFEDVAKEDMKGYKELYQYRNKPFKLSENQYNILNQGLKQTNRVLKNMTNTIAFQSKQAYIDAVDDAYMKVMSGAFDYETAIQTTCRHLASKGITLKDKLGRNVQLEVAVRRNVLSGIHETCNNINRNIEDYLGCDGYEVTAHIGARPTHAEEQGKQFAIDSKDANKYKVGLWSDVVDLWSEYNCRHTYFGIILGVSDPIYTAKELKNLKNATVFLNGKQVPYYEATQKQRQLENAIRKQRRTIQTLERTTLSTAVEKSQLLKLQKKYKDFCKETGLERDYNRTQVVKTSKMVTNREIKYTDITDLFVNSKKYKVEEQQYYKDEKGTQYKVDGKNVVLKPTKREKEVATILGKMYGGKINIIPRINEPANIKTSDYEINGIKFDLKEIQGNSKNTLDGAIKKQKRQASNFIFDITKTKMDKTEAINQIDKIYNSKYRDWVKIIILIDKDRILKVFERQ